MEIEISATIIVLTLALTALLVKVCGKKALKYLLSLGLAFFIIILGILPLVYRGYDPVAVTLLAAIPIIIIVIYCAEGFTWLSHLSVIISVISFAGTALLIYAAVAAAHFNGIVSDTASIVGGENGINLPELLSAGIMLSALGGIIEMVITQVATVMRFISLNPDIDKKNIYAQSRQVGVAHLGAIISTLFLLYAGVSLPLLIIFSAPGISLGSVFVYEPLSTEIVRMITGMIGIVIAMPFSTMATIWWMKKKSNRA